MLKIGIISTFLPTQCGIATYTDDLMQSLKVVDTSFEFIKIELISSIKNTCNNNYLIQNNEAEHYLKASDYINASNIDVVDIQHEFKIFGKPDGENISLLLHHIQKPICTTLHTVSSNLNDKRQKIFLEIVKRSDILYVFSKEAKYYLVEKYKKEKSKIEIIPHGVPIIKLKKPQQIRERKYFKGDVIFISAGHMRSTKGYQEAIKALHFLRKEIPEFNYIILGSNHPENESAQSYRENLIKLVSKLKLNNQVIFISEYLKPQDIIQYIQLSDICLLPYNRPDQSSSGILALAIASGRPIVSTPFQFATAHLNKFSGVISKSFDWRDFKEAIREIVNKRPLWDRISKHNNNLGQNWNWQNVAQQYNLSYKKLIRKCSKT